MQLTLERIIRREDCVRSFGDRRHKVIRVTASYRGEDGFEYRKAFEFCENPNDIFMRIPRKGTHAELNALEFNY